MFVSQKARRLIPLISHALLIRQSVFTPFYSTGTGANVKLSVNVTGWNIYRFVMSATETKLFINESTTPSLVFTPATAPGGNRHFRFGDGDSGNTFGAAIDWILWDVTGAYSPAETRLPDHLTGSEGTPPQPAISVAGPLQSFSQVIGSPSGVQTYAVSGSNLTGDITITPPAGFEISTDHGSTWYSNTSPLTLTQQGGTVASTTVQVRLNAASSGIHEGNITHASAGASSVNVSVTGVTSSADPVITVLGSLSAFGHTAGTPSVHQTYSLSAHNLAGDVTITPPVHFEVSADGGATWFTNGSPLLVPPADGNIPATEIRVRLNAPAGGSHSGNIIHTSSGAATVGLAAAGTTTIGLAPTITVEGTLNNFSQTVGSPSEIQIYAVSAGNLTSNLTITPPEKFEVSGDKGYSWRTHTSPLILAPVNGGIPPTAIMVRLNSNVAGEFDGSIVHGTAGIDPVAKAVSGSADAITGIALVREVKISLAPNPVNERLSLFREGDSAPAYVAIYNVTGVKVNSYRLNPGQAELNVETDALQKGVYLVEYISERGRQVYRVVKL